MQTLYRAALVAAFSFLLLLSIAVTNPARSATCYTQSDVIETLQAAMPGIAVYDEVSGAELVAVAKITGLPDTVGSFLVFKHPAAVTAQGPVLLLMFFDLNGCFSGDLEVLESDYETVKAQALAHSGA